MSTTAFVYKMIVELWCEANYFRSLDCYELKWRVVSEIREAVSLRLLRCCSSCCCAGAFVCPPVILTSVFSQSIAIISYHHADNGQSPMDDTPMVLWSDFEMALCSHSEKAETDDGAPATGHSKEEELFNGDGEKEPVKSNALRIRNDETIENVTAPHSVTSPPDSTASPNRDYVLFWNQLSLTFPSVFQRVCDEPIVDGVVPYISLRPMLEGGYSMRELLDIVALLYLGRRFMDVEDTNTTWRTSLSWLRNTFQRNQWIEGTHLPVGVFILARFEVAAFESFSLSESTTKHDDVATEVVPELVQDNQKYVGECDGKRPNGEHLASGENSIEIHYATMENDQRPKRQTLVELANYSHQRGTVFTVLNVEKLLPFCKEFGIRSVDSAAYEALFFTRLSLLGQLEPSKRTDFARLNQVVGDALHQRENDVGLLVPVATPETTANETGNQLLIAPDSLQEPGQEAESRVVAHKKKKRKSKKRKVGELSLSLILARCRCSCFFTSITSLQARKVSSSVDKQPHGKQSNTEGPPDMDNINSTPRDVLDTHASTHLPIENQTHDNAYNHKERLPSDDAKAQGIEVLVSDTVVNEKIETLSVHIESQEEATNKRLDSASVAGTIHNEGIVASPSFNDDARSTVSNDEPHETVLESNVEDNGDDWETVEVRTRGNRRKTGGHGNMRRHSFQNGNDAHGHSRKSKGTRTPASRKKAASRKVARDIVMAIIDKVDEESKKKKQSSVSKAATNPWKVASQGNNTSRPRIDPGTPTNEPSVKQAKGLRDVVSSSKPSSTGKGTRGNNTPTKIHKTTTVCARREQTSQAITSPSQRVNSIYGTAADQNTAPTYQETASAVSTPSHTPIHCDDGRSIVEETTEKTSSSAYNTENIPQSDAIDTAKTGKGDNPPLPTLLSPENANSATSSVASSLEVPHTSHRHHHSNSAPGNDDVGFHLLDVCDRLSKEMNLFMGRRAQALGARRRERDAIIAALQYTISAIWPGMCHVEMYGSCATQLDLPASDIDVVVVGLDRNSSMSIPPAQQMTSNENRIRPNSVSTGNLRANSTTESMRLDNTRLMQMQRHPSLSSYMHIPLLPNGERVLRLAADLEQQPWAVQVNAIPTASVPVVKVLCDPSRLTGNVGADWMTQQVIAAQGITEFSGRNNDTPSSIAPHGLLPWRGSDVMNGLLSLDITFEGPEHGGLGSTEFSTRVVREVCHETGLHPDATPFVQVLMVLKELLGQRKLNEPYSGGLSSYALLLLVVALIRERTVIREELDRVERQRRAMASADQGTSFSTAEKLSSAGALAPETKTLTPNDSRTFHEKKPNQSMATVSSSSLADSRSGCESSVADADCSRVIGSSGSSWATIAKKQSISRSSSTVSQSNKDPAEQSLTSKGRVNAAQPKANCAETTGNGIESVGNRTNSKNVSSSFHETSARHRNEKLRGSSRDETSLGFHNKSVAEGNNKNSGESQLMPYPFFAQGFNDIVEVLCSGETTAGKLLMHFLLYYGEHFDAQNTAIDVSGKHERNHMNQMHPYSHMSPYIQRRAAGRIDPITGMLTVDPIVVYDPLEGAEHNNVARRCFAWNSVRWTFAQSYATLSSAVERSATPSSNPNSRTPHETYHPSSSIAAAGSTSEMMDPSSPLLRCLISF